MKIQTSDGKVFDVPEENVESFLSEYDSTMKSFEEANKQLADIDRQLHPGGKYGLTRNFLQGFVPGAARAEGVIRSIPSGFQDYSKYRDWARKSATEYAKAHPERALSATMGGALGSSALITALTFGLGGAAGAANTARAANLVARAANTANTASKWNRALRGLAGGAAYGGLYGFMDEPSESLADRLLTGTGSATLGGIVGGATPLAVSGASKIGNVFNRIRKGVSLESLPAEKVENYILKSGVLQNTPEQALSADILRKASAAGATDIYKPAYNMKATLNAASGMRGPELLYNPTQKMATAADILSAGRTPQLNWAAKRYTDFLKRVKDTPGQGLVAKEFLKRNPIAKEAIKGHPAFKDLPVGSFEWFKKMNQVLDDIMPKNIQDKNMTLRNNKLLTAKEDLANVREMIHPGTKQANLDYAIGEAWEKEGNKTLADRLSFIANMPTETSPALSSKEILQLGFKPFQRGRARELIEKGSLYLKPAPATQGFWQTFNEALINAGRQQSNKQNYQEEQ